MFFKDYSMDLLKYLSGQTKKNYLKIAFLLLLAYSCSSDSERDIVEQPVIEQIKVFSFSQQYAYVNDEIQIIGENFINDKSKVEVYLDNISADVISISENNITIKIPEGTTMFPSLNIVITNANITYDNPFTKIAILDNTKNKWIKISNNFESVYTIRNFNAIGKEEIYFALQESSGLFKGKKSFNGGAFISALTYSFYREGAFFLDQKGGGYSLILGYLFYKSKDGESTLIHDFTQNSSWNLGFFVDDVGKNFIVAMSEGRIFKSIDSGKTFEKVHENDPTEYEFEAFFALSQDQAWLAGYTYPNATDNYFPAKILYLKEDGNWYNESIRIEIKEGNYEYIKKIHFVDTTTGYAIARIYNSLTDEEKYVIIKSETKGDTWEIIHESNQKIEDFTFKNKDFGWFISGNNIFKTVNGGMTWELDYTNDTECKGILYNEDILWVIANENILKHYF